jgi:hypothetical protein
VSLIKILAKRADNQILFIKQLGKMSYGIINILEKQLSNLLRCLQTDEQDCPQPDAEVKFM